MEMLLKYDSKSVRGLHEARNLLCKKDIILSKNPSNVDDRNQARAINLAKQMKARKSEWIDKNFNPLITYLSEDGESRDEVVEKMQQSYQEGLKKTISLLSKVKNKETFFIESAVTSHTANFVMMLRACERFKVPPYDALMLAQEPHRLDARTFVVLAREQNNLQPDKIAATVLRKRSRDEIIQQMRNGKYIHWGEISGDVIGEILKKATKEIGIPVYALEDLKLQQRKFAFLDGKKLEGLDEFARRSKKKEQTPLTFLTELTKEFLRDEIIQQMRDDILVYWVKVPRSLREQMGKILTVNDVVSYLIADFGVDETKRKVQQREISFVVIKDLLEMAANEIGIPASMLSVYDLQHESLAFLKGGRLEISSDYLANQTGENSIEMTKTVWASLKEKVEMPVITLSDLVTYITAERAEGKPERKVQWGEIPLPVIKELLEKVAEEFKVPISMLTTTDIQKRPIDFLQGKTLKGLYTHFLRIHIKDNPEVIKETVLGSLKKKLGIKDLLRARSSYRRSQVEKVFSEYFPEGEQIDPTDGEKIIQVLGTIADLYKTFFYDMVIQKDDILNEAWVGLSDILQKEDIKHSEIPLYLHNLLEILITKKTSYDYKKKKLLFLVPNDGDLTEENIADREQAEKNSSYQPQEVVVFRSEKEQALMKFPLYKTLSAIHQAVVWRIIVEEKPIDESFVENIKENEQIYSIQDINQETLGEYYDDAIAILLKEHEKETD